MMIVLFLSFFAIVFLGNCSQSTCMDSAFRLLGSNLGDTQIQKLDYDPDLQEIVIGGYSQSIPDYVSFTQYADLYSATPIVFLLEESLSIKWMVYLESEFSQRKVDQIFFWSSKNRVVTYLREDFFALGEIVVLSRKNGNLINQVQILGEDSTPFDTILPLVLTVIKEDYLAIAFTDNMSSISYLSAFEIGRSQIAPEQYTIFDPAEFYVFQSIKNFNNGLYVNGANSKAMALLKLDPSSLDSFQLMWSHHVEYIANHYGLFTHSWSSGALGIFFDETTDSNFIVQCLSSLYMKAVGIDGYQFINTGIALSKEGQVSDGGSQPTLERTWILSFLQLTSCDSVAFQDSETFTLFIGHNDYYHDAEDSSFLITIDARIEHSYTTQVTTFDSPELTSFFKLSGSLTSPQSGFVFGGIKKLNGEKLTYFQGFVYFLELPSYISPGGTKDITVTVDPEHLMIESYIDKGDFFWKLDDPALIVNPVTFYKAMDDATPCIDHHAFNSRGTVDLQFETDLIIYDCSLRETLKIPYQLIYYHGYAYSPEFSELTTTLAISDRINFDVNEFLTVEDGYLMLSASKKHAGRYKITLIVETLDQEEGSAYFYLTIAESIAPLNFSSPIENQTVYVGEKIILVIPEVSEDVYKEERLIKVLCMESTTERGCKNWQLPIFISVNKRIMVIKPLKESRIGEYRIRVALASPSCQLSSYQDFWIQVVDSSMEDSEETTDMVSVRNVSISVSDVNKITDQIKTSLEWLNWPIFKVAKFSQKGKIQLDFETGILDLMQKLTCSTRCLYSEASMESNHSLFAVDEYLDLVLKSNSEKLEWTLANFSNSTLNLQLTEESLSKVLNSSSDQLLIKLKNNEDHLAQVITVELDEVFQEQEIQPSELHSSNIERLATIFNVILFSILGISLLLNILCSSTIKHAWGLFLSGQLIIHFLLLNIQFPQTLEIFFSSITSLLVFQLPSSLSGEKSIFHLEDSTEPFNSKFSLLGYESLSFVVNCPLLLYIFLSYLALVCFTGILALFPNNYLMYFLRFQFFSIQTIQRFLARRFLFSFLIQTIQLSYMIVLLAAIINFERALSRKFILGRESLSVILACVFLILYSLLILAMAMVALWKRSLLKSQAFITLFGTFFGQLNLKKYSAIFVPFIFFFRRTVIVVIIVCLDSNPGFQLILFQLLALGYLILILSKPYKNPQRNRLEFYNEFIILLLSVFMLIFAFDTQYEELKEGLARICIYLTIVLALVNLLFFIRFKCHTFIKFVLRRMRNHQRRLQQYNQVAPTTISAFQNNRSEQNFEGDAIKNFKGEKEHLSQLNMFQTDKATRGQKGQHQRQMKSYNFNKKQPCEQKQPLPFLVSPQAQDLEVVDLQRSSPYNNFWEEMRQENIRIIKPRLGIVDPVDIQYEMKNKSFDY